MAAPLLISLVLFALLRFRPEGETDLGWHLAQGRLIAEGHWLRTNALAWTTPDEPWRDTSWLFDWLAFSSTRLFPNALGPKLLAGLFFALTSIFLGAAALELTPAGAWTLPAIALLLAPKSTPRPHLAAWAAMAATLWLCCKAWVLERHRYVGSYLSPGEDLTGNEEGPGRDEAAAHTRRLRLWALLPIWLGVQLHSGAIFAAAILGLFSLEAFMASRDRRTLLPLLLAPLCLLAGPDGAAPLLHVLRHWNVEEVVTIQEFDRWTFAAEPALPFLACAALAGPILHARLAGVCWPRLLALFAGALLFLALALRTNRFFYELVVVSAPAVALLFEALRARLQPRTAGLALLLGTLGCLLPHRVAAQLEHPEFSSSWDPERLPVRAAAFLDAAQIGGPGFNGMRDGGYLAWARPGQPVFLDARVHAYPASLWSTLGAAEKHASRFDAFLRSEGAEWALTARLRERMNGWRLLEGNPGWALVYWDGESEVFLRRDVPRFTAAIESFEYQRFHPWGNLLAQIEQSEPGELRRLDLELLRFLKDTPGDAAALLAACASGERQGLADADARCSLAAGAEGVDGALVDHLRQLRPR